MNDKNPDNKKYFTISAVILIIVIIASAAFIFYTNYRQKEGNYRILRTASENVNRLIRDEFKYHERLARFVGKEIVSGDIHDLKFILSIFSEANKFYGDAELIPWSSFNWVDSNYLQLINSRLGIQKNPPSMAQRDYIKDRSAINNPWVLYPSHPLIGIPSGIWAIPVGMGVADKNGNFVGAVTFGFGIIEFENKIQQKLSNSNVSFVVIDNNANIVLQSSGNITKHDDDFYKNNNVLEKLTDKSGKIEGGIKVYDINYSYYQKMDDYPYIILTGFNQSFLDKEFDSVILPRILEFILIVFFALIILLPSKFNILKKQ